MTLPGWLRRLLPGQHRPDAVEEDPNTMERARVRTAQVVERGERAAASLDRHRQVNHLAERLEALWSGRA